MKTILLTLLRIYRKWLSPGLQSRCRFRPTCSVFAEEALGRLGPWPALLLICFRILRCHPFHPGGWDPVAKE